MPAEITKSRSDGNASTTEERNRRGSERVVLPVPLELTAMMPHGARINIQARPPVANAPGRLLDEGIELVRGQRVRLDSLKTEIVASGRILRVEASEQGRFSVAFVFASPAPRFRPITFPPTDWYSPVGNAD